MKTARGRLGLAIAVWAVVSGVFAVFSTEYLLAALVEEPSVQSIARGVAYFTTAFTLAGLVGIALGFGAFTWLTLRWVGVTTRFATIVNALWPVFAILAVYSVIGTLLIWLAPTPTAPADALAEWDTYQRNLSTQYPLSLIARMRTAAILASAIGLLVLVRRTVPCSWLDAAIGVGAGVAAMVGATLLLRLLGG